jgi:hypothetical protein
MEPTNTTPALTFEALLAQLVTKTITDQAGGIADRLEAHKTATRRELDIVSKTIAEIERKGVHADDVDGLEDYMDDRIQHYVDYNVVLDADNVSGLEGAVEETDCVRDLQRAVCALESDKEGLGKRVTELEAKLGGTEATSDNTELCQRVSVLEAQLKLVAQDGVDEEAVRRIVQQELEAALLKVVKGLFSKVEGDKI